MEERGVHVRRYCTTDGRLLDHTHCWDRALDSHLEYVHGLNDLRLAKLAGFDNVLKGPLAKETNVKIRVP